LRGRCGRVGTRVCPAPVVADECFDALEGAQGAVAGEADVACDDRFGDVGVGVVDFDGVAGPVAVGRLIAFDGAKDIPKNNFPRHTAVTLRC